MTKKYRIDKEFHNVFRIWMVGFFVDKKTVYTFSCIEDAVMFGRRQDWKLVG